MMSLEAFNLLIQESYDVKREDMFKTPRSYVKTTDKAKLADVMGRATSDELKTHG